MIASLVLAAGVLTPVELRGRELFLRGGGEAGQAVTATVGDATITAPLPCAGCHGADGRGSAEGGVRVPEITWDALARPSDGRSTSGRKRAAYDPQRLVRAIALGFDSSGNALAAPMPRYQLTRDDAEALVAFLRRLGTLRDPGIADDALTIGVLLPPAPRSEAVRAAVESWAQDVNARGGIYARRLEVRYSVDGPSPEEDQPFAFIGWGDDGVARWMLEHEIPFIRTAGGESAAAGGPYVFDTGPSPADEVRRLVAFASERGMLPLAIAAESAGTPLAAVARDACRPPRCRWTDHAGKARAVLYLDAASMRSAGGAMILVPSALAEEAIAAPLGETIIAARAVPSDVDPAVAEAYRLAPARLAEQWSVLAAVRIVEEVLRRAGAGVTRESFLSTLQSTRDLATGFSPPMSFGQGRIQGTSVVRLLRLDRRSGTLTPVE